MIALLQRVTEARVDVAGETIAQIGPGLLALIGVERGDSAREARRLAERIVAYRVFPDAEGRMNVSLADAGGGLLVVPQFTLAANTDSGNRPSFSSAAAPELGRELFEVLCALLHDQGLDVATGRFGAEMQVGLVNDGPVTFTLRVPPSG